MRMTRRATAYVAMFAAGLSAGALGLAVIWAFKDPLDLLPEDRAMVVQPISSVPAAAQNPVAVDSVPIDAAAPVPAPSRSSSALTAMDRPVPPVGPRGVEERASSSLSPSSPAPGEQPAPAVPAVSPTQEQTLVVPTPDLNRATTEAPPAPMPPVAVADLPVEVAPHVPATSGDEARPVLPPRTEAVVADAPSAPSLGSSARRALVQRDAAVAENPVIPAAPALPRSAETIPAAPALSAPLPSPPVVSAPASTAPSSADDTRSILTLRAERPAAVGEAKVARPARPVIPRAPAAHEDRPAEVPVPAVPAIPQRASEPAPAAAPSGARDAERPVVQPSNPTPTATSTVPTTAMPPTAGAEAAQAAVATPPTGPPSRPPAARMDGESVATAARPPRLLLRSPARPVALAPDDGRRSVVRVRPRPSLFPPRAPRATPSARPHFMAQSHRRNGVTVTYGLPLSRHGAVAHSGPLIIHIPPPRRR
jgi:hypothetical protein